MADQIFITPLLNIVVILPLMLLFMKERTRENYLRVLSVIICYFICNLALTIQYHAGFLNIIHGSWNWDGKIYGIIWGITAYFIFRKLFNQNDFLTLKQNKEGLRPAIIAAIILITTFTIIGVMGNLLQGNNEFNLEALLFQISMPGIDEEIMFRGVLLGLLCSSLRSGKTIWRNPANMIVAVLFGLVHALNFTDNSLNFNTANFIWTGAVGYGLGYIALKSRSILIPILTHNLCNFFQTLVLML